jgi:cysteine-dependent adenosine diphosphate thiazole synthase
VDRTSTAPAITVSCNMAPVAVNSPAQALFDDSPLLGKKSDYLSNGSKANSDAQVREDWEGNYQFAPIHEAEVSRAMIKRYFNMMYERSISDVVIIGAGSAGLSCAYHLAKTRPDLKVTILEANVAPGGGAWYVL